jgi:hypothetical protein
VGQLATVLMVLFGLAWIPLIDVISVLLFVVCAAVLVLASHWTAPPDAARVAPLTVQGYRAGPSTDPARAVDIAWSVIVVGLVAAGWLYFSR